MVAFFILIGLCVVCYTIMSVTEMICEYKIKIHNKENER